MSLNRPVLLEMVTKDKFAAAVLVLAFGDATALTWTRQGILKSLWASWLIVGQVVFSTCGKHQRVGQAVWG